ncbi:MAG: thioether cross-link-forming SCIFF peptide maturase [Ruminococcaceae bacterium]|nr:thioether cross-link-forming SCIFF peptide maturase [Oscillospiraceae bacterium]
MVHLYKNNGYNIVIDANSGCVHSVDEVAYDMIGLFEKLDKQTLIKTVLEKYADNPAIDEAELEEIYGDIIALKESKQLFSEDEFADFQWDFKKRNSVLKAICLHVAHDCNLACKYCFAGKGEYNGEKALMSYETGKQALDFLVANSGTRHNLEVDFFGGEPLMNFEVVKQLTAYGRSLEEKYNKNFRFTLTTNGILVDDEVIDFCNKEMSNVVLSIDGRKCVNDRMRVSRNGKGSYDHILPKFLQFVEQRGNKDYYLRGTYTGFNKDFSADILHLADLGFKELSMEPVVCDPSEEYSLHDEDVPALCEQYQILADEMLKRKREKNGFTFYHYMIDLMGGPCIAKRISGCGVGVEYMAVTPTGELYPCHQFVSDERFLLGNVWDGVQHPEVLDEFKHCNVYAHEECKDCFARLYCSGGCAANAFHSTGSIRGVYKLGCELHKKRIECAIMLKVAEQTEGLEE